MPRQIRKSPHTKTPQRNGAICLTKLVIGVSGAVLFATLHQRTIRQWQRFLQNCLQSTEFQAAIEPALSSFNLYFIAIGASLVGLARFSALFRMHRQPQIQP